MSDKMQFKNMLNKIIRGDCLEVIKDFDNNSIDAIVTDPPYGISFMNKKWDYNIPSVEIWQECLRVLKPGGHLLCFCGTRTQHRMAVNIEDAGFEIRDLIAWVYGSGFPKSLDVGKSIDKMAGAEREVVGKGMTKDFAHHKGSMMNKETTNNNSTQSKEVDITAPATEQAKKWDGWGSALKPAMELITMARKPLSEKNIASNVLKWGTGGINIAASRIGNEKRNNLQAGFIRRGRTDEEVFNSVDKNKPKEVIQVQGRFPANLIHDGSDEVLKLFPESTSGGGSKGNTKDGIGIFGCGKAYKTDYVDPPSKGSAARFFYCAKEKQKNRGKTNSHPTIKPIKLIQYLVKLVTPPDGIVLDPFAGSGTTGLACRNLGFNYILIEKDPKYIDIINKRLELELLIKDL